MKQFWYGEGDFIGLPIPGGVREMNSRFDYTWRTALAKSEKTRYSRISTVMETIAKCSGGSDNGLFGSFRVTSIMTDSILFPSILVD